MIPTYNEADNIEGILRASAAELDRIAPGDYRILVVDDSSPDGTGALAERIGEQLPRVEVLHRREQAEGWVRRIWLASPGRCSPGAEFVFEMDADFSHDPRYLEPLLDAARDVDLVLGSRYVPGGGV